MEAAIASSKVSSRLFTLSFWASTVLLSVMMLFSVYSYFTNPQMLAAFQHLGFPDYFRVELGIAKFLGVVALILPGLSRVKEWAYAGFAITFISAFIAHESSGDPTSVAVAPLVALFLLVVSYISREKLD